MPARFVCSFFELFQARLTAGLLESFLLGQGRLNLSRACFCLNLCLRIAEVECRLTLLESPLSTEGPRICLLFVKVLLKIDLVAIDVVQEL